MNARSRTSPPGLLPRATAAGLAALALLAGCHKSGDHGSDSSLAVRFKSPTGPVATNGTVTFEVETADEQARVELWRDGARFAQLVPPLTYEWDTRTQTEGAYSFVARAIRGGRSNDSAPVTVTVDRTPPTVVARAPAPEDDNVPARVIATMTFSEPIDAASVVGATRVLDAAGTPLDHAAGLTPDGATLNLLVSGPRTIPNRLTIDVAATVRDRAGNPIVLPPDAWRFSLPEWLTLGAAQRDAASGLGATACAVAVDGDDRPLLAWAEFDAASQAGEIHVRRFAAGVWEPLGARIGAVGGYTSADRPAIVADAQRRPVVAFEEQDGLGGWRIRVRRLDTAGWIDLGAGLTATLATANAHESSLALDATGEPIVAWSERDGAGPRRIHVHRFDGSAWHAVGGPLDAVPGATDAGAPTLAVDGAGNPAVAFEEADGQGTTSIWAFRWDGSAWAALGGALSAEPGATSSLSPSLCAHGVPALWLAWSEADASGTQNVHVREWDGTSWQPFGGALSAFPGATSARTPRLAVRPGASIALAWLEPDGAGIDRVHLRIGVGGSWLAVAEPLAGDPAFFDRADVGLVVDSFGLPVVAWRERSGATGYAVLGRRLNR